MAKQVMLTEEGLKKLEAELEVLKGEKRTEIAEKIKVARSYGDLSENSEYDDAKNEQAILEARIADIEASLKNAVIIDESEISNDRVHLGSTVKIKNLANDMEMTIRIVGSNESDPKKLQISDESPVGMGLIGKSIDDVAEIETPGGVVAYKVMEISR
ncbi:MAG: transcription elongation factor GreA [Ruminococcus sp.]|nr:MULTISPECIES: transcription elongation factor GreA [Ruminococcus]MCI5598152.1 transcription elongation factor GreA [Ruminococcus sp.]MDD6530846.1 transcription elongation factor GreA [Ruminococcus sp.]MDY3661920.1 transcription elongation factor GreA [Ruminococcus bovis]